MEIYVPSDYAYSERSCRIMLLNQPNLNVGHPYSYFFPNRSIFTRTLWAEALKPKLVSPSPPPVGSFWNRPVGRFPRGRPYGRIRGTRVELDTFLLPLPPVDTIFMTTCLCRPYKMRWLSPRSTKYYSTCLDPPWVRRRTRFFQTIIFCNEIAGSQIVHLKKKTYNNAIVIFRVIYYFRVPKKKNTVDYSVYVRAIIRTTTPSVQFSIWSQKVSNQHQLYAETITLVFHTYLLYARRSQMYPHTYIQTRLDFGFFSIRFPTWR